MDFILLRFLLAEAKMLRKKNIRAVIEFDLQPKFI